MRLSVLVRNAESYIRQLGLIPHPEGGFYRETYRSAMVLEKSRLPGAFAMDPPASTAIYFLLTSDTFSALHRIRSDELWHFYDGDPLEVHQIAPDGRHELLRLGRGISDCLQGCVPAGRWFGARVAAPGTWSLVGCTVAPGFCFEDFEMGKREELEAAFPRQARVIASLTRG